MRAPSHGGSATARVALTYARVAHMKTIVCARAYSLALRVKGPWAFMPAVIAG